MFYHLLTFLFLCFPSNMNGKISTQVVDHESKVGDLNEATRIIQYLINHEMLHNVLEPCEPGDIDRLIKNFSPAEMAFEAEVLNWEFPVIIFFVEKDDHYYRLMHNIFDAVADKYDPKVQFVEIDTDELFKITEQFYFEKLPSLCLMYQRVEINRCEGINGENFEQQLQKCIEQALLLPDTSTK